jgi:hypothetical protein
MKNTIVNFICIVFLAIGIVSAFLIVYDYYENPRLISKEQAFDLAIKTGNWSENFLKDKTFDVKLLHQKTNQFAFIVDEKTLEDIMPFCPQSSQCILPSDLGNVLKDGQYVWIITIQGQSPNILSGHEWGYMIDAENGQVLR